MSRPPLRERRRLGLPRRKGPFALRSCMLPLPALVLARSLPRDAVGPEMFASGALLPRAPRAEDAVEKPDARTVGGVVWVRLKWKSQRRRLLRLRLLEFAPVFQAVPRDRVIHRQRVSEDLGQLGDRALRLIRPFRCELFVRLPLRGALCCSGYAELFGLASSPHLLPPTKLGLGLLLDNVLVPPANDAVLVQAVVSNLDLIGVH